MTQANKLRSYSRNSRYYYIRPSAQAITGYVNSF